MIRIDINIKKVKGLLCLFCLCIGWAQSAFGVTHYVVRKIEIVGNCFVASDLLIALSGLEKGKTVDPSAEEIRGAIQKITKQDGIKSVAIYLSEVDQANGLATFVIDVEEHPRLASYLLEGLTKKEQKMVLEKVTIANDVALSPLFLQETASNIKNIFLERGFRKVAVATELMLHQGMGHKATLKVKVNKGKQSKVHKIIFQGNNHLDADLLLYNMKALQEAPRFTLLQDIFKKSITLAPIRKGGILLGLPKTMDDVKRYLFNHISFSSSVFTEEKYLKAKKDLILFYQSQGFRDAHIAAERLQTSSAGKLNVHLTIQEGKQYMLRHIKWVGNYLYSDEILNKLLNLKKKRIYDPVYIKSRLVPGITDVTINDLYTNNGYLFFRAELVETGIEDNQVDLEIRIQEGKQVTIRQVDIVGNTLTHDYVIRRELLTLPGEKYNQGLVRESLRNLAMLRCFKPEKLIPEMDPDEVKGTVDLTYVVEEEPKFDLKLNGSYSKAIIGSLQLGSNNASLKNLFTGKVPIGAGQDLHLTAELHGKNYKNFSFSFQEPWFWLGGSRYILAVSFNSAYHKSDSTEKSILDDWVFLNMFPIGKQDRKTKIYSTGGRISLGKNIAKYWSSHLGVDYHYHTYQHCKLLEDHRQRSGVLHDFTLDFLLHYSTINHPNYPTAGCEWHSALTLTPPYTLFGYAPAATTIPRFKEFGKFITDIYYFKRLLGNCVFHFRGHAGFLHSLSKNEIGPFERFYLGGTSSTSPKLLGTNFVSLRGYPDGSLTPKDYTKGVEGGVLFNKFVSELRYPLMLAPICCYLLGFVEVGDSWLHYRNFNLSNIKKSIGGGVRLILPIPIIPMLGLDFGYKLDPEKNVRGAKSVFEYHFTIGPDMR
ncbi:MAG: BamA/TamA family outer membrane protein [Candidatus Cardinium sp.]|uniref:BamA/OMP85 family outer membrane protein n=1 Tax=Cardinium endosymbiont of Dermatophagoides farinae TaxID=2597823 RepID=UPI001182F15E|nr:POTRA domain-containing protein [Cardinium endosymbiont of Dermatophagoides farinae]TSJ81277.1 BamA/TamA family outer membrane protein [Cardinium endosymbiont of Dermatophagoides farinae]UWW97335.1 MAG: BamA/TamA family outer membrane protein [Candidatus Cardinium sp.]